MSVRCATDEQRRTELEIAGVRVYHVTLTVAYRGGMEPREWDWDSLVGDPPLAEECGTKVLDVGGWPLPLEDVDRESLDAAVKAIGAHEFACESCDEPIPFVPVEGSHQGVPS